MDDVLQQYAKQLDVSEPVICLDEQPYQLLDDTRLGEPAAPGKIAKQDYEYQRCGTCSLFVAVEPKAGKRFVWARSRRTRRDFALFVRELIRRNPQAKKIHLVLDNLNTHNATSLLETFHPHEAKRLLKKIVWHHTPKHASWLNMAEIEISVLARQCLSRRVPTLEEVQQQATTWARERNRQRATINWTFKKADARRTFPELYRHKLTG